MLILSRSGDTDTGDSTYSLVAQARTQASNNPTTPAIDTTGANLIVLTAVTANATFTPSDNNGNVFTAAVPPLSTGAGAGTVSLRFFYSRTPAVRTDHTFSFMGSFVAGAIFVSAWSSAARRPLDQTATAAVTAGSPVTSLQLPSLTPTRGNALVIAALAGHTQTSMAIDSGFVLDQIPYSAAAGYAGAVAYLLQTTAVPVTPTWSWPVATYGATAIVSFLSS